jgi:hypothetical protein
MKGMLKALTAVAMATAFTASTAHAQTPVSFGVGGGVSLPLGNFSDASKLGFQGTALVQFAPANLPVGFRVDGTYQQNKFSDLQASLPSGDGKFQTIFGTADVVYTFKTAETSKIHPYLIAGGGVYNFKTKLDAGGSGSDTKFGANGGAGFDMAVGSAKVFLEGRFHNIFISGNNVNFIPITVGVKFGG